MNAPRVGLAALVLSLTTIALLPVDAAQTPVRPARISERVETLKTYPFSEPNEMPILARDTRLYPYHSFDGYAHEGVPKPWTVVTLENDLVEVFVLPQVGGKVWGARVKKTGHEFIYRNEVMKFRNIALRGPWTSGGIEFNFGVVGHTPATATPVDYTLRTNPDGSVSCIVGTMDLPSRTEWRVEIRLPADSAAFETHVVWHNPTVLEQPYYNWMTAAAFAKDDLEMSIPGTAYLTHPGAREAWPTDPQGRYLPSYKNNQFGSNKSFHVVGLLQDFFGGYYAQARYGFGHWARHEEMPGQKLWLWALSRAGGIWEDLLTDTDGQYVEYQAGRLLVQFTPDPDVNPITQVGFDPQATDRWSETWFPLEGLGGLSEASSRGALSVREGDAALSIGVNAFRQTNDVLRVWSGGAQVLERAVTLTPLEPLTLDVPHRRGAPYRVTLAGLDLDYNSDTSTTRLSRPYETDATAMPSIAKADQLVAEAKELIQGRRLEQGRPLLEQALSASPWHREGLLALADLEYRRAQPRAGLAHVQKVLKLDAYDAQANFIAGNLYRALRMTVDAREAYGWASRALAFRTAAYTQLADLAMTRGDAAESMRYARLALNFNRDNLSAWQSLAVAARVGGDHTSAHEAIEAMLAIDPLHHFAKAEVLLTNGVNAADVATFVGGLRSEFPEQTVLEIAARYLALGRVDDAQKVLDGVASRLTHPMVRVWRAYLKKDAALLSTPADVRLVFPYRLEDDPALRWATETNRHWSWAYLRSLLLWSFDRRDEALAILEPLGSTPDVASVYLTRATLIEAKGGNPEPDFRRADQLAGSNRPLRIPLIQFLHRRTRWQEAADVATAARTQFPGDFNLDLLYVRSLNFLGRGPDAVAVLDRVKVLPSEHARESHQLWVQAHVLSALSSMDRNEWDVAARHLTAALEWPEHLGQGKPYDPEERLVRYLMGFVARRQNRQSDARSAFEAVVAATPDRPAGAASSFDRLVVPALRALGRDDEATRRSQQLGLGSGPVSSGDLDVQLVARAIALGPR